MKFVIIYFFSDISKKSKKIFIDENKKYFPIAKNINRRLKEIKLIDIKWISREKKDLILNEIASLKYLSKAKDDLLKK